MSQQSSNMFQTHNNNDKNDDIEIEDPDEVNKLIQFKLSQTRKEARNNQVKEILSKNRPLDFKSKFEQFKQNQYHQTQKKCKVLKVGELDYVQIDFTEANKIKRIVFLTLQQYEDLFEKNDENYNKQLKEQLQYGEDDPQFIQQVCQELEDYFQGKRKKDFSQNIIDNIDLEGSEFQVKIWKQLLAVPFGETISYKQLAERIGQPTASRAAANACGQNNWSIIVPCHRITASNNQLGGFSSGLERKKMLHKLEEITL